jgi:hypothetical protein
MIKTHIQLLERLCACKEAVLCASDYPDLPTAWQACRRGDWMLWYCGSVAGSPMSESRRRLTLAAARCTTLAVEYTDNSAAHAPTNLALTFGLGGQVTLAELASVDYTIIPPQCGGIEAAIYFSAISAVRCATLANYASYAASNAAHQAACAVSLAGGASLAETLDQCASIVRELYPDPPREVQ